MSFITLLLVTLGLAAAEPQTTPTTGGARAVTTRTATLHVMSFNIRYATADDGENRWELRRSQLFELLRTERPDLIGLQEALHGQIEELLAALPEYGMVGVGRSDGQQAGEYAAILYRRARFSVAASDTFWFSDTPTVVASTSWGNTIERICTWARLIDRDGGTFYLYNVHLDHRSQPSRERAVALLLQTIDARQPPAPVIVTGDFNAGEANPATRAMTARFKDSFRLRQPEATEVGTSTGFTFGRSNGEKIDYVFVEPGVAVTRAEILRTARDKRYPSDHFPVVATIELPVR